ncbi:MAG: fructosamine kinase [Alphaproteobacteria bacterium RIFOXYD12_FULL_60_8]|nr:MAG: fructosamine kinase [Alphaproteobacteria bacterium RIFOXYD12_FULL_60_8]
MTALDHAIQGLIGSAVVERRALSGGCVSEVFLIRLADGRKLVAKVGPPGCGLDVEGFMLDYLRGHSALPVPEVIHGDDGLLLMSYISSVEGLTASAQAHAGELLAALHAIKGPAFGFERDTLIGGLHQPNPFTPSWREFFRDQRLLYMAGEALRAGRLPARLMTRIESLCGRLERWIEEPTHPSLIHGDLWTGNVLCAKGQIAGFIDPAIYYADPEIELAFSTLFGTFGAPFFEVYQAHRPVRPGFFEERRELYNLYPLLVHVRLFGGSYVDSVERGLSKFGC